MTYKKNVADLRNSLAFSIFKKLKKRFKNQIQGFDPFIKNNRNIMSFMDLNQLNKFRLFFILVDHNKFEKKFKLLNKKKIIKFF